MNTYLQVIAYYYAHQNMGDKVEAALLELAKATRTEPENISYEFFRSAENINNFVILEKYKTQHGLALHRETSHFQNIGINTISPLLEKKIVECIWLSSDNTSPFSGKLL